MFESLRARRFGKLAASEQAFDAGLALLLFLYGQAHVWLGVLTEEGYAGGPRWLDSLVIAGTTLPLACRRRAPLGTLAAIMAALALPQLFSHAMISAYAGMLPALIASYTTARNEPGRRVLAGLGIVVGGLAILTLADPAFRSANEFTFEAIVWSVAWLLGWGIQSRERRTRQLEGRAAHLERDREARAKAAVLDERARIARELHDVVAHGVSLMVVQAGAARLALPEADWDGPVGEPLRSIEDIGRQSLGELRRLLAVLREDEELLLEPLPGMDQLDNLVAGAADAGLPLQVRIEGEPAPLPSGIDLTAYRIVQEALTNTIKHARGASASLTVRYLGDALEVEAVDDGAPAPHANGNAGGHGLLGMRERVLLYGGELDTGPRPEGGFAVRARLPLGGDAW